MKTILTALLALVFTALVVTTSLGRPLVGGYHKASVTDPAVVEAAKCAIKARSEKQKVALVKILKAETQVVAGINFRLRLEVKVEGGTRFVEIIMWKKLDNTYELTKWEWKSKSRSPEEDKPGTEKPSEKKDN